MEDNYMTFSIVDNIPIPWDPNIVYLINNDWDDWFEFETVYIVQYQNCYIGNVKIGQIGQTQRRASLPKTFSTLSSNYFSLGTSVDYYANIKDKFDSERIDLLTSLNDISYNLNLFDKVKNERVTKYSLLRDISINTVRGQFHRISDGGAILTNYDFKYVLPDKDPLTNKYQELQFVVDATNNTPSSNIHVLIGNNGIGKTTIIKGMLSALLINDPENKYGRIETGWDSSFANVVNISFSAFDDPICPEDIDNKTIPYTYTGLIYAKYDENKKRKRYAKYDQLPAIFFENYYSIIKSNTKRELWKRSIHILETDNTFKELEILSWDATSHEAYTQMQEKYPKNAEESQHEYQIRLEQEYLKKIIGPRFSILSSGHKNILLTLVSLINKVEEKTLVILDEPEEHLHPPLVSAFIRALSDLLTYRNGVAIIATHSPVIVQEVPKKCVWKIRRNGIYRMFDRPIIETFGENLGEITTEVFSYDIAHSGFHALLQQASKNYSSYEKALSHFNDELGNEAKSILMSYMYDKENL